MYLLPKISQVRNADMGPYPRDMCRFQLKRIRSFLKLQTAVTYQDKAGRQRVVGRSVNYLFEHDVMLMSTSNMGQNQENKAIWQFTFGSSKRIYLLSTYSKIPICFLVPDHQSCIWLPGCKAGGRHLRSTQKYPGRLGFAVPGLNCT